MSSIEVENLLARYAPIISSSSEAFPRNPRLLLEEDGPVRIYYAPFEYVNSSARIVLVGITPGPTQMVNALREARIALAAKASYDAALKSAKETASFSGEPMRSNLISQLNHWQIHKWLGIGDSSALFAESQDLVHLTSLLRYPVFVDGKDYRGSPDMTRHRLLRLHLEKYFVAEVRSLPDAVFLGLGPAVQKVLDYLVDVGLFDKTRVIGGLLHPSGNNTYRIRYLVGDREGPVPHATNPVPYDIGRQHFQTSFVYG